MKIFILSIVLMSIFVIKFVVTNQLNEIKKLENEISKIDKEINKLRFKCSEVSEFTNSPEILEGRVKTLHPKIHAGILNKRKSKIHLKDLKNNGF